MKFAVRVIRMRAGGAVATFARNGFVLALGQLVNTIRMTFVARLASGKLRFARGDLLERIAAIPAVLTERGRREQCARGEIRTDDKHRQQNQSENLRWHAESVHRNGSFLFTGRPPVLSAALRQFLMAHGWPPGWFYFLNARTYATSALISSSDTPSAAFILVLPSLSFTPSLMALKASSSLNSAWTLASV